MTTEKMINNSYVKGNSRVGYRRRAELMNLTRRVLTGVNDLASEAVMVTGATNFIGYPLCQELINSGYKVFGTVKEKDYLHGLMVPVVKYIPLSVDNKTDWDSFFRSQRVPDAIVHIEELDEVGTKKDNYMFKRVNRDGTSNLASFAAKFGVKHFILISSIAVNGGGNKKTSFSADDVPEPKTPYAISKWEAEEALKNICTASGMKYTILRVPLVYGANVGGPLLSLLKEISNEEKIPYVDEKNIRNMLYVRNLTSAILFSMFNAKAQNKVFVLKDAEDFRVTEVIYRLAELMDKKVRMIKVPRSGLKLASYMKLSSHGWLAGRMEIDDTAFLKTGWKPKYSTFTGFSEMIEWFIIVNRKENKTEKRHRFFIG